MFDKNVCFCKKSFVVYHDQGHDKQQSFSYKNTHVYGKPEFLGKHAKLTRPPKVTYGIFWKKNNKLSHTLLRCAHFQKNPLFELFEFLDAQNMCFGACGRFLTFLHVQKSRMSLSFF